MTLFSSTLSLGDNISFTYDRSGNTNARQITNATPPVIQGSTLGQIVSAGGFTGFSVLVASPVPVTYQWYRNGNAIEGATGDSLLFPSVTAANEGNYIVTVTNSSGSVTSRVYTLGIDASGNGLPDAWELANFGNLNQTADGDSDLDGISNAEEFIQSTNPTVADESSPLFAIKEVALTSTTVTLVISSQSNRTYQLQGSPSLNAASWADIGVPKSGNGQDLSFTTPQVSSINFYRIKIVWYP